MKNCYILCLLLFVSPLVSSQPSVLMDAQGSDAARMRIVAQRQERMAAFDEEDRECRTHFAVTGCQDDVARRRRVVIADLRRQELALSEADRQEAGRVRLQQLHDKAAENAARLQQHSAAPPGQPPEPRKVFSPSTQNPSNEAGRSRPIPEAAVDPAVLAARRKAYAEKQEALLQRRQERDKRMQTPSKPGLPTPP